MKIFHRHNAPAKTENSLASRRGNRRGKRKFFQPAFPVADDSLSARFRNGNYFYRTRAYRVVEL